MFQDVTRDSKQPLFLFLFKMQYTELAVEEDANLASTQSLVFTSFFVCLWFSKLFLTLLCMECCSLFFRFVIELVVHMD